VFDAQVLVQLCITQFCSYVAHPASTAGQLFMVNGNAGAHRLSSQLVVEASCLPAGTQVAR
jgi:hypothetical protein